MSGLHQRFALITRGDSFAEDLITGGDSFAEDLQFFLISFTLCPTSIQIISFIKIYTWYGMVQISFREIKSSTAY